MKKRKNILICPLEWGLGHAARMIPVAANLQKMNNTVYIGAGEEHLALFRAELKGLTLINFPGFMPGYSKHLPQYLIMLFKTPLLLYHIILEHHKLKKIIRDYKIDIVISDNRFGLWNRNIKSVYITHLPLIPLPRSLRFIESIGALLHRAIIKRYNLCFIPDLPGMMNISGRLSHGVRLPENVRFAGILSRFNILKGDNSPGQFKFPHNTVILSGPEPQRGILKQKLCDLLIEKEPLTVILEGKPGKSRKVSKQGNIIFYNHLPAAQMRDLIKSSESIISRSGYTTIMDLISLNCTALLIPTPGQTEQEYLAAYLTEKGWFSSISQKKIKEGINLPASESNLAKEITEMSEILLKDALGELLED